MCIRRFFLLLTVFLISPAGFALEGGSASGGRRNSNEWQQVRPISRPSAQARQQEVAARAEAMQAEIARLRARLQRVPDAAGNARLRTRLEAIVGNYGWVPEAEMVWGVRDIQGILANEDRVPEGLLKALIQLKNDLAARGVDFVFMPFPPTPHYQAHLVVEGLNAESEYSPGWTKMLIELLENDIEIIDTLDAFRREATNPVVINWPNDFHTASLGRQLMARALAERLQRYDFARELAPNRRLWSVSEHSHTGAGWPQRITTVNNMFQEMRKDQIPAGVATFPSRHPARDFILRPGAPDLGEQLKNRTFNYFELNRSGGSMSELGRFDLVSIGDSQLHSAVHGAGLPEFINAEIGGVFRWGSKSWQGFDPPRIYREVVPDGAPVPRVVVLSCLVKYFWEAPKKYSPVPLPAVASAATAFEARVRITGISAQRDVATLEYDEALSHLAAVVIGGPRDGEVIGIVHWTMHGRQNIPAAGQVRVGQTLELSLQPWSQAIAADPNIAQHCIYNDTDQADDLTIPVYWVTGGALSPQRLLQVR